MDLDVLFNENVLIDGFDLQTTISGFAGVTPEPTMH